MRPVMTLRATFSRSIANPDRIVEHTTHKWESSASPSIHLPATPLTVNSQTVGRGPDGDTGKASAYSSEQVAVLSALPPVV